MTRQQDLRLERWLSALSSRPSRPGLRNLYEGVGASDRVGALRMYLALLRRTRVQVAMIGEAPGHRGSVQTGVPFVCPAQATDAQSAFRRMTGLDLALPAGTDPTMSEVTSTAMWNTLAALGITPLLWAACSDHPHVAGQAASNRTPRWSEVKEHESEVRELLDIFKPRRVIAVGAVAERFLNKMGIANVRVRHPARGGAASFHEQLLSTLGAGSHSPSSPTKLLEGVR